MSIMIDVLKELFAMFVADARLTLAILLLVAVVAGFVGSGMAPILGGGVLLMGSLGILVLSVGREAKVRKIR
jgi:hypothetical protein